LWYPGANTYIIMIIIFAVFTHTLNSLSLFVYWFAACLKWTRLNNVNNKLHPHAWGLSIVCVVVAAGKGGWNQGTYSCMYVHNIVRYTLVIVKFLWVQPCECVWVRAQCNYYICSLARLCINTFTQNREVQGLSLRASCSHYLPSYKCANWTMTLLIRARILTNIDWIKEL
jgi:hypothetical protein